MANLNYKAFTGNQSWWSPDSGDAYAIDELFSPWVDAINLNASQQGAQVEKIYGPSTGLSGTSSRYMGNLTRFPVSTNDSIYWHWAATNSGMRVTFSEGWQYSVANNGYGGPDEIQEFVSNLTAWESASNRSYLVGTSTEDNREFFALGWNTGPAVQYQNAIIIYKDRYGGWAGMAFDSLSAAGLFYSATNNTYNSPGGANLPIATTNVLVPLTIPFAVDAEQDYVQGQFISQPASLDLYALGSVSEFGKYVEISTEQYVTSLGYNAFWVRHGVTSSNINVYQTIVVTVETDPATGQGVYYLDGVEAPVIDIDAGLVYAFDQTDPSNVGHPIGIFTEAESFAAGAPYPENRDQLGAGVLVQNNITYLSISTTSTAIEELYYGSLTAPGYAGPDGRFTANINVVHEGGNTPGPTPTPDPDTPAPSPDPGTTNGYVTDVRNIDGQNLYYIAEDPLLSAEETPVIEAAVGSVVRFDQSDPTNAGHPIAFYTDSSKAVQYTTGYSFVGTAGQDGAYSELDLGADSGTYVDGLQIYYQCVNHPNMGGSGYIYLTEA